jgi:Uma2 family endonuclease
MAIDPDKITVDAYFRLPESTHPMELVYGIVHEPPAPFYSHQSVVTRLTSLLDGHVAQHQLGRVCVSPIDVVLDAEAGLVLQPDLIFISTARLHIIADRIWGAPDLVVEVLSPGTARRDRTFKIDCYRRHGVAEAWVIDPEARSVQVHTFDSGKAVTTLETFDETSCVRSKVLPRLCLEVRSALDV